MSSKKVLILGKKHTIGRFEDWICMDTTTRHIATYKFLSISNNFIIYLFCKWDHIARMMETVKNYIPVNQIDNVHINVSFTAISVKTNVNFLTLFGAPRLDDFNPKMCVIECSVMTRELANYLWEQLEKSIIIQPFFYMLKPYNILMRDILQNILPIENRIVEHIPSTTDTISMIPSKLITVEAHAPPSTATTVPVDLKSFSPMNVYTIVVNKKNEITGYSPIGTDNILNSELVDFVLSRVPVVFIQVVNSCGLNYPSSDIIIDVEIKQIIISLNSSFHIVLAEMGTLNCNSQRYLTSPTHTINGKRRNVTVLEFDNESELLKYFIHVYCHGEIFKHINCGQRLHFLITENYRKTISYIMARLIKNNLWHVVSNYCRQMGDFVLLNSNAVILTEYLIDLSDIIITSNNLRRLSNIYIVKKYLRDDFFESTPLFDMFSLKLSDFKNKQHYNAYKETKFCHYDYIIKNIILNHEETLNTLITQHHMLNLLKNVNNVNLYMCDINILTNYDKSIELDIFYSYLANSEFFFNGHIKNSSGVLIKTLLSTNKYLVDYLSTIQSNQEIIRIAHNQFLDNPVLSLAKLQTNDIHGPNTEQLVPVFESIYNFSKLLNKCHYNFTKNFNPQSDNLTKIKIRLDNVYESIIKKYHISLNNQCIVLGVELICILTELRNKYSIRCFIFQINTMQCLEDPFLVKLDLYNVSSTDLYILIVPWLKDPDVFKHSDDAYYRSLVEYFSKENARYSNMSFGHVVRMLYNKFISFFHKYIIDIISINNTNEIDAFRKKFEYSHIMKFRPEFTNNVLEVDNGDFLLELPDKYVMSISKDLEHKLNTKLTLFFDVKIKINVKMMFSSKFVLKYARETHKYIYFDKIDKTFRNADGRVTVHIDKKYLNKLKNSTHDLSVHDFKSNYFSTVLWCINNIDKRDQKIQQHDRNFILNNRFISNDKHINTNVLNLFFSLFFIYENQLLDGNVNDVNLDDKSCLSLFYKELK